MMTDSTICLNYFDENGKQRSLQDRIYHTKGIAPAITTSFHYSILEMVNEERETEETS